MAAQKGRIPISGVERLLDFYILAYIYMLYICVCVCRRRYVSDKLMREVGAGITCRRHMVEGNLKLVGRGVGGPVGSVLPLQQKNVLSQS
jgi:hypothetical protein